jgi:transposase-like protein
VSGRVSKRAVYVVLGVTVEGTKSLLGLWIGEVEAVACFPKVGAKFWLKVLTDLKKPRFEGHPDRLREHSHESYQALQLRHCS